MSNHYVMFGDYRIACSEEYMNAFGLVDGQSIDHVTVDGMNKLADAASDMRIIDIGHGIARLRESHATLLAAAKEALANMNDGRPDFHPSVRAVLEAAIAAAEERHHDQ